MKTWKAKKQTRHDIWVSEIRLKQVNSARRGKVMRLLVKLEKEGFDESDLP